MTAQLAILANPMSGRDVRRLAARASNMTHEAKRDIVARVAAGADAMGVTKILVMKEAFRIASMALEHMPLDATVEVIDVGSQSNAADSVTFLRACRERGCETLVSLGGDGTNRLIARTFPDAQLIPLSTGTNNVFPIMIEATAAGEAAGLVASGRVKPDLQRCKVIHIRTPKVHDIAVIDALLLERDHVGNMLPFEPDKMRSLLLTRAEPSAVGTSPIGGMLQPVWQGDDLALAVNFGSGGKTLRAPLSPGLFRALSIRDWNAVPLGEEIRWQGPGVIAVDGDREIKLLEGEEAVLTVERDGPWMIDVHAVMGQAVADGLF